ncbi:MAG TPA: aldose epimerase family protein [Kiritimatiellia bacterium]|mgnify:CR=1 FL=1|nr:aldose epimerase family protein [Kiritimatiellia bacterium]
MKTEIFGHLPDGRAVHEYVLENGRGLSMHVLDYGGIVTRLNVPDARGRTADVVLGFDHLAPYLERHPYFGALVGRVAGRITGAAFTLDGKRFTLPCNEPPNHLHGGVTGFDRRLWQATPEGDAALTLSYRSPDGEEGYPGNLDVRVTFRLTPRNEWTLSYEAETDAPTPFCPTHHSYFNLAGESSGGTEGHRLQIFADYCVPTDESFTLSGRLAPVTGTADDFNRPRLLGDAVPHLFKQHGNTYLIRRAPDIEPTPTARLEDPASGRVMDVATTERFIQFYSSAMLDGTNRGKSCRLYAPFSGVCLECQGYADGANRPEIGDIILRPGNTYRQTTVHAFSNM